MALFQVIECFLDLLLFWLPGYDSFKLVFLLWLTVPFFGGSGILYRKVVHPFMRDREREIESRLARARRSCLDTLEGIGRRGMAMAGLFVRQQVVMAASGMVEASGRETIRERRVEYKVEEIEVDDDEAMKVPDDEQQRVIVESPDDGINVNDWMEEENIGEDMSSEVFPRRVTRSTRNRSVQLSDSDEPSWMDDLSPIAKQKKRKKNARTTRKSKNK